MNLGCIYLRRTIWLMHRLGIRDASVLNFDLMEDFANRREGVRVKDNGVRASCYARHHEWGECDCKSEFPEGEGFEFEGMWITDATVSECGRFFVDPYVYYGEAYMNFLEKRLGG